MAPQRRLRGQSVKAGARQLLDLAGPGGEPDPDYLMRNLHPAALQEPGARKRKEHQDDQHEQAPGDGASKRAPLMELDLRPPPAGLERGEPAGKSRARPYPAPGAGAPKRRGRPPKVLREAQTQGEGEDREEDQSREGESENRANRANQPKRDRGQEQDQEAGPGAEQGQQPEEEAWERPPLKKKGRPKKDPLLLEGGREGRSRSRSPRGGKEDLGNIAFLHDQKLSPWHFRMSIEGTLITGPLRASPGMARQDWARLQQELNELRTAGTTGKDLLEAMKARAKALKDEVKAAKKQETHERRKTAKRERYRASQESRTQASQSSTGEGSQRDDNQLPADAQPRAVRVVPERAQVDHDPPQPGQRPARKRRKQDSEPKSPQRQPKNLADAEVQTDRNSEDTEEAPRQDADYPVTPPPKKRGCKMKKLTQ